MTTKGDVLRRACRVIGDQDAFKVAAPIRALIDAIDDDEMRSFVNDPKQISGVLLPQCLGGKVDAPLSLYCAACALIHLQNEPVDIDLAADWVAAAESCENAEVNYYFTKRVAQSKAGSNKPSVQEHAKVVSYWNSCLAQGVTIGVANERTCQKFGITVRNVQKIRKAAKQ